MFTLWPSVWAAGGDVMNADGTDGTLDTKPVKDVLAIWRQLYADGVAQPGSKDEQGPTWVGRFQSGKVGVGPMPSTTLAMMEGAGLKVGVAPISGPDGGQSTFVGGDVLGIAATTEKADAAWNFLAWSLSDDAQVEVLAKHKDLIARTDLAENKYSAADPRVVTSLKVIAHGQDAVRAELQPDLQRPAGAVVGHHAGRAVRPRPRQGPRRRQRQGDDLTRARNDPLARQLRRSTMRLAARMNHPVWRTR